MKKINTFICISRNILQRSSRLTITAMSDICSFGAIFSLSLSPHEATQRPSQIRMWRTLDKVNECVAKQIKHKVPNQVRQLFPFVFSLSFALSRDCDDDRDDDSERGWVAEEIHFIIICALYSGDTGPPNYSKSHYDAASTVAVCHRKLAATRYRVSAGTAFDQPARYSLPLFFLFMIFYFLFCSLVRCF